MDSNSTMNSIGIKFKYIQPGEFIMGSNEYYYHQESPMHNVSIRNPFYLGIYTVTQKEWETVMNNNPSHFKGDNKLPVDSVSWTAVQDFIEKLNKLENTDKYRLPTEAEWEYAARAGTTSRYSFGDDDIHIGDHAWFDGNSKCKTHPVGEKKPNPWGLYDMHGNVWEWVQDTWHNNYKDAPANGSAWEGGEFKNIRILRGGSYHELAGQCWSSNRNGARQSYKLWGVGFRLVKSL